ncbi:MAG: YhdP family protein [Ehrlichia sp.]
MIFKKADSIGFVENFAVVFKNILSKAMKIDIPVFISHAVLAKSGKEDLMIRQFSIKMNKGYDKNTIDVNIENDNSFISMKAYEHYKGVMSFEMSYGNFDTKILGYLGNLNARLPLYENLNFSGDAILKINEDSDIAYGDVNIQSLKGAIPCVSSNQCYIHDLKTRLIYQNGILSVKNFSLLVDQSNITATGAVESEDVNLRFNFDVISPEKLCDYWFVSLYPDLNKWYCNNVTGEEISDIKLQIKGKWRNAFIHNDLSGYNVSANITNVSIKFSDSFDPVKIVQGKLLLYDNNFVITSDNSNFKGMTIQDGVLKIEDISDENAIMSIDGNSVGNVKELYGLLGKEELIWLDENKIFGDSYTNFDFKIFNLLNDSAVDSESNIHAQVKSFSADGIFGTFDVYDTQIDIILHNSDVSVNGKGYMNGYPMSLTMIRNLEDSDKSRYEFIGYISNQNMIELKVFDYENCSGIMKANLQWDVNNDVTEVTGSVDFSQLKFRINGLSSENFQNVVKFSALFRGKNEIELSRASIVGDDVNVELNGKLGTDVELFLNKIKLKNTDVRAELRKNKDYTAVKIFGKSLDLSGVDFSNLMESSAVKQTKVNVAVDRVLMKNNVVTNNVDFKLDCYGGKCSKMKLTGNFLDNSDFDIEYGPIGLEISTNNAGDLLRAMDILKTVDKGKLSLYLYPIEDDKVTHGMVSLTNFYIVNASILAQILTLSSLKGVVNTLNGKGIYFNTLNVPFIYQGDLINITESWMEGSELGISLGGEIDIKTKMFDVKGQIIPAYIINKIIWQTPIIGKLLTGGQSRGVIAIDYKVKGTDKDHDLSVNFMSILTPNLLKRVLKIFDTKLVKKR